MSAWGGGHACYPLDVTDAPALHDAATDFMQRFGAPHIVIANAGVSAGTLTECEEDLAVFRRVMDTNVFGMAATFAPFIPAMRAAGGERRLAGIASVAGIRGLPGAEAYSASKAAAIAYLESLRLEMRPYGIPVVTIAPGYIETPMTAINPYRMPFLLPADEAARRMARAIERGVKHDGVARRRRRHRLDAMAAGGERLQRGQRLIEVIAENDQCLVVGTITTCRYFAFSFFFSYRGGDRASLIFQRD